MRLQPLASREWVHHHILEAPLQGVELLKRAWLGVNIHWPNQTPLFFRERIFSFLMGSLLLTPFINQITWIAWQVFGHPTPFFDDYYLETKMEQ